MTDKITVLAGEFDKVQLQEYCNSLFITNKKLIADVDRLKAEIAHLQMLLSSTVPLLSSDSEVDIIEKKDEKIICDINIARIRERTLDKEISFEDAKKLEILVKTKKLIEGEVKTLKGEKGKSPKIEDEMLVSLASQTVESDGQGS